MGVLRRFSSSIPRVIVGVGLGVVVCDIALPANHPIATNMLIKCIILLIKVDLSRSVTKVRDLSNHSIAEGHANDIYMPN
jgi:hypothetical protein